MNFDTLGTLGTMSSLNRLLSRKDRQHGSHKEKVQIPSALRYPENGLLFPSSQALLASVSNYVFPLALST